MSNNGTQTGGGSMRMMKALVHEKAGRPNASIKMVPYPTCADDEVIIKIMACGICKWAEISHDTVGGGGTLAKYPVITGHEFAGYIEEVGKDVADLKVGDRVTADNAVPCGKCWYCKNGKPLFCEHFGSHGHNLNGGFAQYMNIIARNVVKIPDWLPFDQASITEPVACAIEALDRADIKPGEEVLVSGMGPHGLILAQLCHFSSAQHSVAIGLVKSRLDTLAGYGVPTILADRNDPSVHEAAIAEMFPNGVDCIIDTSGSFAMVRSLMKFLRKGGRFVQYGSYHRSIELDDPAQFFNDLHFKNQSYIGVSCQVHNFPRAVEYMANRKCNVSSLVTHTFELDDYFQALDLNKTDKSALKVIIHPNGDPEAEQSFR
jgi:D-arabinitol dehydrogenase (NADP+)